MISQRQEEVQAARLADVTLGTSPSQFTQGSSPSVELDVLHVQEEIGLWVRVVEQDLQGGENSASILNMNCIICLGKIFHHQ